MEQAVPAVHLTFYHLAVVIRDMSDIYRYSDQLDAKTEISVNDSKSFFVNLAVRFISLVAVT